MISVSHAVVLVVVLVLVNHIDNTQRIIEFESLNATAQRNYLKDPVHPKSESAKFRAIEKTKRDRLFYFYFA